MNLLDCYVTEIIEEPYFEFGFWWQKVKYESYGIAGETSLYHKNKEFFETIRIGFKFLS